jgi:hypothetical protein
MTKIEQKIKEKETGHFTFNPNRSFYDEIGINQKRWGQIYRGEIDPTITELKAIASFFDFEITDLI